jgi:hypothetical protein
MVHDIDFTKSLQAGAGSGAGAEVGAGAGSEVCAGSGGARLGPAISPLYSIRLGDPAPRFFTTPAVALASIFASTSAGEIPGSSSRSKAATPATCGVAMDVPLRLKLPVLVFAFAETMFFPGAKMSMHVPKLYALESSSLVAPTVIALVAEAGVVEQASLPEFPAATTMTTPTATALFTAMLTDSITTCASRLRFATALLGRNCDCCTTKSMPAITDETVPDPVLSKTLTEIKLAFLAIPYFVPPTVPGKVKEGEISECEYYDNK